MCFHGRKRIIEISNEEQMTIQIFKFKPVAGPACSDRPML